MSRPRNPSDIINNDEISGQWKNLFCNKWFKRLEDYGDRWGIAHVSFDGVSVAEIIDADLDRLIETWERILIDLETNDEK